MPNQYTALPMPERFWVQVVRGLTPKSCWVWAGAQLRGGYGSFGQRQVAHRVAYELSVGPIPAGLEIDHLCRNRLCVRPDHLEAVDRRTNIARSESISVLNARKTHCPKGHPYSGDNLRVRPNGDRRCAACIKASNAVSNAARNDRLRGSW